MTKKLWQTTNTINSLIEKYTSGEDVLLDAHLVKFGVNGNFALVF